MTLIGHQYHQLPLCGRAAILGIDLPLVVDVGADIGFAHVDHRFNGKDHTRSHNHLCSLWCYIADIWIFMEFQANTVTANVRNNGVSVHIGMFTDSVANVTQESPWFYLL